MTGPARPLCYRLADRDRVALRRDLAAHPRVVRSSDRAPDVTVAAAYTKNGQTATLPLPDDLAADLAALRGRPAPWRRGLPAARQRRERRCSASTWSEPRIPYGDAGGLVFDFHSLRCQCATLADRWRVTPSRSTDDAAFEPWN